MASKEGEGDTPFLDPELGQALAEEAIEGVEEHADEAWKASAELALQAMAQRHQEMTTDEVWEYLHQQDCAPPHEKRAMGPLMRRAAKNGWIRQTDRFRKTGQPSAHRRPQQVWESQIYSRGGR